uniref:Uncharacterized protein n=1 Tax=viral metagenome TaxID=1070528 RepID=A0A6C0B3B3_9ZZZZ
MECYFIGMIISTENMAAVMSTPGDFSFMDDQSSKDMLEDMYKAVTLSENWDNLKGFVPGDGGFMFSEKPAWFSLIDKAVKYNGHSGASHGWTMRCIDYIAKHGWDNFVAKMSKPDEATKRRLRILELPYSIQEARKALKDWEELIKANPSNDKDTNERRRERSYEASIKIAELERESRMLS